LTVRFANGVKLIAPPFLAPLKCTQSTTDSPDSSIIYVTKMQKIALFFLALFAMLASVCRVSFHCVEARAALYLVHALQNTRMHVGGQQLGPVQHLAPGKPPLIHTTFASSYEYLMSILTG
jgi:hypothetical protein